MAIKQVRRGKRKNWAVKAGMIFAAAVLVISLFFQFAKPYAVSANGVAAKEPWIVKVGEDEAFIVASEEEGQAVIDGIKEYYCGETADQSEVTLSPQMTLEKRELKWKGKTEPLVESDEAVAQMVVANRVSDPLVTVTTKEQITETEPINYEIKYRDSKSLDKGEVRVVNKGKKGKKVITSEVVRANGKVLSEKIISTSVEQKPTVRVIEKGTSEAAGEIIVPSSMTTQPQAPTAKAQTTTASTEASQATATAASDTKTKKKAATEPAASESRKKSEQASSDSSEKTTAKGEKTGQDVVNYALKFVGNPYVYGGTSLTKGTDCSGFTKSVYAKFGYSLPRTSKAQRSAGKGVSYSEAKPGDIICYSGHVAIYMGKGKIVHASTPSTGIKVSKATYKSILTVRRIIK